MSVTGRTRGGLTDHGLAAPTALAVVSRGVMRNARTVSYRPTGAAWSDVGSAVRCARPGLVDVGGVERAKASDAWLDPEAGWRLSSARWVATRAVRGGGTSKSCEGICQSLRLGATRRRVELGRDGDTSHAQAAQGPRPAGTPGAQAAPGAPGARREDRFDRHRQGSGDQRGRLGRRAHLACGRPSRH